MLQVRRGLFRGAFVAAAVIVMTACSSSATNHSTGTTVTSSRGGVARVARRTVRYSGTAKCAPISEAASRVVLLCAGTSSIDGNIAAVANITFHGRSGTDTSIEYDANGARHVKEAFTEAVSANGTTRIAGHGTCIAGGTGVHKNETCSYTLTGEIPPDSTVSTSKEVGTTTR